MEWLVLGPGFLAFCWVGNNTPLWSFHICTATVLTLTYVDMVEVYCASFVVVIQAQRVRVWLGIEVLLYENYLYCNKSRLLRGFFRSYTHACCCIGVYVLGGIQEEGIKVGSTQALTCDLFPLINKTSPFIKV